MAHIANILLAIHPDWPYEGNRNLLADWVWPTLRSHHSREGPKLQPQFLQRESEAKC